MESQTEIEITVNEEQKTSRRKRNLNHGYYCFVPHCKNCSLRNPVSFHSFPSKSRGETRRAWIIAIRRDEGKRSQITSNTRVCSAHFNRTTFLFPRTRGLHRTVEIGPGRT